MIDLDLDKLVDATIDDAISAKHEKWNYDEEMSNLGSVLYKPWIYGGGE